MSDCITNLCRKVNSLLLRVTSLEALMNGGESPTAFFFNVTGGSSAGDITGGAAQIGPGIDETLNMWSSGGLAITVTDGSARVRIEPSNLSDAFTTAGPPATPPKDSTRPALHLAANGLYFWSPSTVSWVLVNLIPVGDDWGNQVAISDGTTVGGTGVLGDPLRVLGVPGLLDLHSETGAIALSSDGVIRIPEVDGNDVPTGRETLLDVSPSSDSCNGIQVGADFRHYSEDFGYRIARTWQEVIDLIDDDQDVLICQKLLLDQNTTLDSDRKIKFVKNGAIDINGFDLILHVGILNPNNRQVFYNVVINETYPARWDGTGTNLKGNFGHSSIRYPDWFGASPHSDPFNASLIDREKNNHAIAAAALSSTDTLANSISPVTVQLSEGFYPVWRTIRLDGRKVLLKGHCKEVGWGGTVLVAQSIGNVVPFNTDHFITTFKFPVGTTPVIEIGFEFQASVPPGVPTDVGMQCGVQNIGIRCPPDLQAKPISGIMFEYGFQENSRISQVSIQSYSGYGIGNPEEQHLEHNEGTGNFVFPQVNSVVIEEFVVQDPAPLASEAIGISIHGLSFTIRNGTVSHHNGPTTIGRTGPPMLIGTRHSCVLDGLHLEWRPTETAPYKGAAIAIEDIAPGNVNVGAIDIRSVMGQPQTSTPITIPTCTVWTSSNNVAFHMSGIRSSRVMDALNSCIEDTARGKRSTGSVQNVLSGYVALYARQYNQDEAAYRVVTTDFGLL